MKEELLELYNSKWVELFAELKPIMDDVSEIIKPACPLLISIEDDDHYKSADIKLMIFGQETNSWHFSGSSESVKDAQDSYDEFFNSGDCWGYGKAFWNGVKRFMTLLQNKYPEKRIQLVWNNLVKIGKQDDKGFPEEIYEIEREKFKVITKEIEILKPNIILFLSGPHYDEIILENFGQLEYKALTNYTERQLSKLEINNVDFAYRTYHPNFLWRNNIDEYFETILYDVSLK